MRPLGKRQAEWVELIREAGGLTVMHGVYGHVWLGRSAPRLAPPHLSGRTVPLSIWDSLQTRGVIVKDMDHSDWRASEYVLSADFAHHANV